MRGPPLARTDRQKTRLLILREKVGRGISAG